MTDEDGQVIQRHTVDYSNLVIPSEVKKARRVNIFESKGKPATQGTKALGIEFHSFVKLREKVNVAKDKIQ